MNTTLLVFFTAMAVLACVQQGQGKDSEACPTICPLIYKPVCGAILGFIKPKTYGNFCELGVAKCNNFLIFKMKDGKCKE